MTVDFYPTRPGSLHRLPITRTARPCSACAEGWCQPGWCEEGIEHDEQPTALEVSFSNDNARELLLAVGLGSELLGALAADEIGAAIGECVAAMRSDADGMFARSGMLRERQFDGRCLSCEQTDEDARARLGRLLAVLGWALDHGVGIAWS